MNWVEAKAERERQLAVEAPKLWDQLCDEARDAVESYRKHYAEKQMDFTKAADHSVFSVITKGPYRCVIVVFESKELSVRITWDIKNTKKVTCLTVVLDEAGHPYFAYNGKQIGDVCKFVTESVLFDSE